MEHRPEQRAAKPRSVSRGERLASALILGALAAIALAIAWRGQQYAPDAVPVEAGRSAAAAPAGPEPTPAAPQGAARGQCLGVELASLAPPGWRLAGPPEQYRAEDLYVKIDGRAELYLAYGVRGMAWVGLAAPDQAAIDVYVYEMATPLDAFGVFAAERPPTGSQPAGVGHGAYMASSSVAFHQGPCYAQLVASADTPALGQQAMAMARKLAAGMPDEPAHLWGEAYLPAAARVPGSLQYARRHALGLDFLGNAFTANYTRAGEELAAFAAEHADTAAAAATVRAFQAFWAASGATVDEQGAAAGPALLVADAGGYHDAIFRRERLVAGVVMAADRQAALQQAREILLQAGRQP